VKIVDAIQLDDAAHDHFVMHAPAGTFLHSRRFRAHQKGRFSELSLAVCDDNGKVMGIFPAAVDPSDDHRVISHPGLTYGGILHAGHLRGPLMVEALTDICRYYGERGFRSLRYKTVPYIYDVSPAGDDLYALFRLGARRYRCDLLSTIDLRDPPARSERRRRSLNKALKAGVEVLEGAEFIPSVWAVLEENLARKHGAAPVHGAAEIIQLQRLFPEQISIVVGSVGGNVEAGVVLFVTPRVVHAQYIASSSVGYEVAALDAVFDHCIREAAKSGVPYFDFGSSNEQEGWHLNEGLFKFKSEFGAGSVAHEFYELDLLKLIGAG
jgi:hypothetical protein